MSKDDNKQVDATTMQELKDAHAWGKDKDEEELIKAIGMVFRDKNFPWISCFMDKRISGPEAIITDENLRAELQACRRKLVDLHVTTIEKIAEGLQEAAGRLPNNQHNIQDALEGMSSRLDPFEPAAIETACLMLRHEVYPRYNSSSIIFNKDDMDEEYQRGFEAGYERCLQQRGQDIDERFESIDLHE